MAIVEMAKIKLIGMNTYKDNILNALQRTGCVDLSAVEKSEEGATDFVVPEELSLKYDNVQEAISFITEILEKSKNKSFYPKDVDNALKNFFVSYSEFTQINKKEKELLDIADKAKDYNLALANIKADTVKLNNTCSALEPYLNIKEKFSDFSDTKDAKVFFGTVKQESLAVLKDYFDKEEFAELCVLQEASTSVILVVALYNRAEGSVQKLNEAGFVKCQFDFDLTAIEKKKELLNRIKNLEQKSQEIESAVCKFSSELKELKILCDYYKFLIEKEKEASKFSYTNSTFLMQGYLPRENIESVRNSLTEVSSAVFMEFSEPEKDDNPPTLTKNDRAVSQTEFITDMYSAPNYRELDPNKAVFFFFMLFMGVIMADIGYGFIMIVLGIVLSSRIKVNNGSKKLWNIIAIGGIFTIIFGVLFNSLFGFAVLPFNILPSPVPSGNGTDDLMIVLLLCLLLGVIQIAVGYFIKALNSFRQKDIAGGIFDGLIWVLFFIGFILAVFNFILDYLMSDSFTMDSGLRAFFDKAQMPGLFIVIGSLVIAALTAGRKEKGFGKFSKGFGSVYGLINIMSDILSYARLFGLMLSGMIIGQTFNDIGMGMMNSPIGYVLGGFIMVLGHTFNIAMGVLGAYIHDSRLQYIEFFGKFYTGEGNKFNPLGSEFKYIYLNK